YWHQMERKGSSFTAKWGGELIASEDMSFRPVDLLTGPDGAVYIADWADRRANHVDPVDNWDRTRGRIWKLQATTASGGRKPAVDLAKQPLSKRTSQELVALLSHPNDWQRREARRILAERRDTTVVPALRKLIEEQKEDLALEALWALYVSGGFNDELAMKLLDHANEDVRTWTVRLLCDPKKVAAPVTSRLVRLAREDTSNRVRSQLACSAKRLSAGDSLPIVRALLLRAEDVSDPHLPLLTWWAIEDKAASHRADVLKLFAEPEIVRAPLANQFILERLARRWMAGGEPADLAACARLLENLREPKDADKWIAGVDKALEGRALNAVPMELTRPLAALTESRPNDPTLLRLTVRLGSTAAYQKTLQLLADSKTPPTERLGLIDLLGQIGKPDCVPVFLKLLRDGTDAKLRAACLTALQRFPDASIGDTVLELYPALSGDLRNRAQTLLAGRPASALSLLKLVDAKQLEPKQIPLDQLQRMMLYKDDQITKLIEKHWGKVGAQSSGEKQSRIRSLALIVRRGKGDAPRGKELFTKHCAVCHQLFNEGNKVGPELTGIDRKNLEVLLVNLVDPSAFIRPEYVAHNVITKDGRIITGLIAEDNAQALTILDAKNERTVIAKNNIDELAAAAQSLMPEKILDPLTDQEICDLFAWLQSDGPPRK
ncbi:MAG: c-type cytochrome, partial [Planctomycetia bacterium]|nr:c-type cytochrome [Planctomycetia bacterium]